jgi:hypothetical protein
MSRSCNNGAALPDRCGRGSSQGRRPVPTLCHREDRRRHLVDAGLASHVITPRAIARRLGAHPRAQPSPNVRTYRRETCHRGAEGCHAPGDRWRSP